MRRKHRKRTRRKQRGGVRFSNILTAENAHRFNKILDDDVYGEYDEIDVYIRIIPMPWMSDSKTTLDDEDDFWVTHPMRDIRELTNNPGVVTSNLNNIEDNLAERLVDRDGSPEPFPFIEAMFSDDDRSLWHPLYRDNDDLMYANTLDGNRVALKIPNNTQEVIDTLHGDRSHGLDYLIEVVHGYDTTAQISRRARGAPGRQRARRRLAFAKALHSRLGENSVMGDLDPETYSKIESLMQRGGSLDKNQIITVENRDRYVGQVIEIVPIHVFDDHLIDDSGGEEIKNFMNKICKIANTDQYDIDYYGDNIINVSIDIHEASGIGDGFILRVPRNLQELEDDLNSTNPRYLYYVRLGNQGPPIREEDARKELLLELQEDEVDDNPDSPVLPNEYQRAKQALIKLQSRARGKKTRKKLKGLSSRKGIWKPTRNNREKMRRWIYETQHAREDDPIRGYEQYRIYDPIRGFQPEIDMPEPYDEEFLERYNRMKYL
mgnify:CR=1 FL=1